MDLLWILELKHGNQVLNAWVLGCRRVDLNSHMVGRRVKPRAAEHEWFAIPNRQLFQALPACSLFGSKNVHLF